MKVGNLFLAGTLISFGALMSGCYTAPSTVVLNPGKVPGCSTRHDGNIALKFEDGRTEKTSVGKLTGRIGKNAVLEVQGKLEERLADLFSDVLTQAGYRVVAGSPALLEGEVREFWVHADGWTQAASERIRLRLRDKAGLVLWEQTFRGEDGGMDMVDAFAEKSMNIALTRLLSEAAEQFGSESFYHLVQKAAGNE